MESGVLESSSLSNTTLGEANPAMPEKAGNEPPISDEDENSAEAEDIVDPEALNHKFSRHDPFETKHFSTLRTSSVPSVAANAQAKQDAFLGRAFSAPASYTPLDAEDMRMQAVRGIHMNIFLRRKSSTEGLARLPSATQDGPLNEAEMSQTVKMMQALLREMPHRSDGAAALRHLEIACKELGMERGRRNSIEMMQDVMETQDEEEEEELTLEGIIQDMQQGE